MAALRELAQSGSSRRHELSAPGVVIGRGEGVGLYLDDASVSRIHARVSHKGGAWVVESLASQNPVKVSGHPVTEHRLRHGERIEVGPFVLEFDDPPGRVEPRRIEEVRFEPLGGHRSRPASRPWGLALLCWTVGVGVAGAILFATGWLDEVMQPAEETSGPIPWEERFGE